MSNLGDLWKDLTDNESKAVDGIGAILGTLADISGAVGLLQSLFSQDDQVQQTLNAIWNDMNQIQQLILVEDKLQRMRDIDSIVEPAFHVFRQLPADLSSGPLTHEYILTQIGTCEQAILSLADYDDKWQAVMGELPTYSDDWSGTLAPQPGADPLTGGGLVFNYMYTLPQFLRTISFFLTTVGAFDPSSINDYQQDLKDCATRLQSVHDTIVSGIVGTRIPTSQEVGWVLEDSSHIHRWLSPWYTSDQPWSYGAVEVYSGTSNVSSYWKNYIPHPVAMNFWQSFETANFLNTIQFRILQQKKALYIQLGMPIVRNVINQLRTLTGQQDLTNVPYETWSIGEVFSTLGLTLPADHSGVEPALATFLQHTPPYTNFLVYTYDSKNPKHYIDTIPALPLPAGDLLDFFIGVRSSTASLKQFLTTRGADLRSGVREFIQIYYSGISSLRTLLAL